MRLFKRYLVPRLAALLALSVTSAACFGQFSTAPSTYATTIQVQEEVEGTEFDDWIGVPVAYSDPVDNVGNFEGRPFIDFADIQVANDDEFLYIHMTYHNESSFNTFIGIDVDQDTSTGYDLFDLGLIGSEVGYQNDFPFQQFSGVYNLNVGLTGGPLTNGGALIYTFWDQDGMDKEWAIPLDLGLGFAIGDPASTVAFLNDSIDITVYTEEGAGDIIDVISYTLATAPSLDGDYNSDGVVDAADYTVWRDSDGDIGVDLPADGNGDGEVSDLDYTVWSNNYGAVPSGSAIGVPEPTAALLLGLGLAGIALGRRSA